VTVGRSVTTVRKPYRRDKPTVRSYTTNDRDTNHLPMAWAGNSFSFSCSPASLWGLATVAGLQAFDQTQTRANQGALIQDAVRLFADAKGAISQPLHMGGGADVNAVIPSSTETRTSPLTTG